MLLYRFVTLAGLLDLMANRRMYLRQVMRWEDAYETDALRGLVETLLAETDLAARLPSPVKSPEVAGLRKHLGAAIVEHTARSVYAQSWTQWRETDALWRIYSPDKRGVRLAVDRDKILAAMATTLHHVESFNIEYRSSVDAHNITRQPFSSGTGKSSIASLCRFKRPEFEHEKEYRFCWARGAPERSVDTDDVLSLRETIAALEAAQFPDTMAYSFDPDLVDEVTLDPRLDATADQWYIDAVRNVCEMAGIDARKKLNQSELYRKPTAS